MAKQASAGNKYSFLGFLDSDGYLIGGTPSAPANGSASNMYRLLGIKEAAVTIPPPDVVQATGDDGLIAEFTFESIETRSYIATMAVGDLVLESYLAGTNVETIAGGNWVVTDVQDAPQINVCVLHQQRAKYQDTGIRGVASWGGYLIPVATATYLGRDAFTERSVATFSVQITPSPAGNFPWGVSFNTSSGTNSGILADWQSPYPYTMAAITGNGSNTWVTDPDYTPVNAASSQAWYFRTPSAVTNVTTTVPYTFTTTGNLGAGLKGAILYQFQG